MFKKSDIKVWHGVVVLYYLIIHNYASSLFVNGEKFYNSIFSIIIDVFIMSSWILISVVLSVGLLITLYLVIIVPLKEFLTQPIFKE